MQTIWVLSRVAWFYFLSIQLCTIHDSLLTSTTHLSRINQIHTATLVIWMTKYNPNKYENKNTSQSQCTLFFSYSSRSYSTLHTLWSVPRLLYREILRETVFYLLFPPNHSYGSKKVFSHIWENNLRVEYRNLSLIFTIMTTSSYLFTLARTMEKMEKWELPEEEISNLYFLIEHHNLINISKFLNP